MCNVIDWPWINSNYVNTPFRVLAKFCFTDLACDFSYSMTYNVKVSLLYKRDLIFQVRDVEGRLLIRKTLGFDVLTFISNGIHFPPMELDLWFSIWESMGMEPCSPRPRRCYQQNSTNLRFSSRTFEMSNIWGKAIPYISQNDIGRLSIYNPWGALL